MKRFPEFDTSRLRLKPLAQRRHDLGLEVIRDLVPVTGYPQELDTIARRLEAAKSAGAATILMMGAHVLRCGVQRYLIDLMERGFISCLAFNGAVTIHDYEFALIGQTTESVAKYIQTGEFGLWTETGAINDIVAAGALEDRGMGEAVGRAIHEGDFPHKDISLLAKAYALGIPATVHVGIGYDIIHEHPNFNGAAFGKTSYTDFLRFAHVLESVEHGVVMNFGSSVMAPEVYLKALAMVRNVAAAEGRSLRNFTTLVCDLKPLPGDYCRVAPKSNPEYYFRPWKTMLVRTVADGGESFYVCGDHGQTVPGLWSALALE